MLSDIRNEECPKCHERGVLFVCSMGAVNCSNCCEYIRPLTAQEWDARQASIEKFLANQPEPTEFSRSLHALRIHAEITLREMANALGVKASEVSGWENGTEPTLKQLEVFLRIVVNKLKERKT